MMAIILGSMLYESFEFELSLKHGCEQQIQTKSFTHISSICFPLTFCRNEKKGEGTRTGIHNSNPNTTLLGPTGRQMHEEPS
jgi:hypothetical protein